MLPNVVKFMDHDFGNLNHDLYDIGWGKSNSEKDTELLNRICDYFQKRIAKEPMPEDDSIWDVNIKNHSDVIQMLLNRDIDGLHENFKNLFSSSITHGTTQGNIQTNDFQNLPPDLLKHIFGLYVYDCLLSVLEYSGAITAYSIEEHVWVRDYEQFFLSVDNLLDKLFAHCNIELTPPQNVGMLFGIKSKYGVYAIKDMHAIGLALMIKDKFKGKDLSKLRVCEIGGGVGQFAYYMNKIGFTDYSIVDIPSISISQMYFLETNIGKDKVKLLSPDEFDGDYDIIINVDSMPEMPEDIAESYIEKIAEKGKYFVSVNQERLKFTVNDLCEQHDLIRISRNLFWFRKGYLIEEFINNK